MGLWTRAWGSSLLRSLCGTCACVMCWVCVCVCVWHCWAGMGAQWCSAGVVSCCQNVYNPLRSPNSSTTKSLLLTWLQCNTVQYIHKQRRFLIILFVPWEYTLSSDPIFSTVLTYVVHSSENGCFDLQHLMCLRWRSVKQSVCWNKGREIL